MPQSKGAKPMNLFTQIAIGAVGLAISFGGSLLYALLTAAKRADMQAARVRIPIRRVTRPYSRNQ